MSLQDLRGRQANFSEAEILLKKDLDGGVVDTTPSGWNEEVLKNMIKKQECDTVNVNYDLIKAVGPQRIPEKVNKPKAEPRRGFWGFFSWAACSCNDDEATEEPITVVPSYAANDRVQMKTLPVSHIAESA